MAATLVSINLSGGGMPKLAVPFATLTRDGLVGDWQRNRKYHGGPDRAVCLFSQELYAWLADQGVRLSAGQIGENFTTAGLDLVALEKGDQLQVGPCVIELTGVRKPCRSLDQWDKDLMRLIQGRSGWLAKVVTEGGVKPGDGIELLR